MLPLGETGSPIGAEEAGAHSFGLAKDAAKEYILAAREYLGEPPEREMAISCRNESELMPIINQMASYHIRSLRHYYHQTITDAETRGNDLRPSSSGRVVGATE